MIVHEFRIAIALAMIFIAAFIMAFPGQALTGDMKVQLFGMFLVGGLVLLGLGFENKK